MEPRAVFVAPDGQLVWKPANLPPLGPEDVRIKVEAAGVNRPDLLQRRGLYPPPPGASEALGLEVAGTVDSVGSAVTRLKLGDDVMALVPGGGYADAVVAHEGSVMLRPPEWSPEEAAAFPETAFTVWANVFAGGRLSSGERLFLHGATSGIGTMAASMAKATGHEIFGTAGSAEKVETAERHGFDKVWNYKEENWSEAMRAEGGADLVLDMVGGDYLPRNLALLRDGGRHVSIAFLGGASAPLDLMQIMRRRLTLTGSTLRARSSAEKSDLRTDLEAKLLPLIRVGKIKPLLGMVLPMAEVEKAHEAMMNGALIGKAVLRMSEK
ncbi:MAG: NAD(P)H-quinone oxidoreductase [Pseudomonadota bacterium]